MSNRQMVINYAPGEECRVAVVEDGTLDEFYAERADSISHVGNIYVGKVTNVERSIQAAFVDFGLEHNGFLHVSDLHPQYFAADEEDKVERVGHKTPRRERPPLQDCLRRGQEIIVQVLKEGVGTKGPTLTSYISIPGRFLVMMPSMDRVGVSRKVEDEDVRRKMREILDQLELPDGFGFIVRTAGLDRTKLELKRDLAYLQRLWKDMERRRSRGKAPKLLYSESDLLVRALRDMLTTDIDRIVIDDESALRRAARFLKIVAPRSATRLVRYSGPAPVFHALGVEKQIAMIHSREVPLPSGGRLVIDETEALVAIDVNSGRMRDAKDAETNAYRTNLEAVDEICRQLRLRDLGGIVINDLIDMRASKHRKDIENRFKENLKKDRARSTVAPISPFGVLEMTRQRMRGSHESVHFATCPICRGRGVVQRPDSVCADAMRELSSVLSHDRVARVELVVSARIAGELLSSRRRSLSRLERASGKRVDVRVSDAVPVDRVSIYAYDERAADVEVAKLPMPAARENELVPWEEDSVETAEDWAADMAEEAAQLTEPVEPEHNVAEEELPGLDGGADDFEPAADGEGGKKKRRRRRRRRGSGGEPGDQARTDDRITPARSRAPAAGSPGARPAAEVADADRGPRDETPEGAGEGGGKKKRRRRRRRRGGEDAITASAGDGGPISTDGAPAGAEPAPEPIERADADDSAAEGGEQEGGGEKKPGRSRRRRRSGGRSKGEDQPAAPSREQPAAKPVDAPAAADQGEPPAKKKSRRKRGGAGRRSGGDRAEGPDSGKAAPAAGGGGAPNAKQQPAASSNGDAPAAKKPRALYAASRRKLSPSERHGLGGKE